MTDEIAHTPNSSNRPTRPERVIVTFEEAARETAARRWRVLCKFEGRDPGKAKAFLTPQKQAIYDAAHEIAEAKAPIPKLFVPIVRGNEFLQIRDPLARAICAITQEHELYNQDMHGGFLKRCFPALPSMTRGEWVRPERRAIIGFVRELYAAKRINVVIALDVLAEGLDNLGDRTMQGGDPLIHTPASPRKGFFSYYELLQSLNEGMRAKLTELAPELAPELERRVEAIRPERPPGGPSGGKTSRRQ